MEEKEVLLTQEGFDNIEKELEYLRTEKRAEIAERIKVALGFGDLSENSEYDEAKNAQAENEAKIAELENKVRYAKIIDEKDIDTKTVQVGNTVKLYDIEFEEEVEYTIVGSTEVNLAENRISNESPIGKALIGAKKGAEEVVIALDEAAIIESMQCVTVGGGARGSLITTIYLILITLVIAIPIGVIAAIFLVEYAKDGKVKYILTTLIDMTSGIPSIIFGFCGALIFIPFCNGVFNTNGYSILAGAFTMTLILLPTIIKTTSEALLTIPKHYTMASLALGASKTQTIFKVILPNSIPGILTATLLSIGRIIGESAALIFVTGTAIMDDINVTRPSTSLSLHIWSIMNVENPNYGVASAIAIFILIVVLLLSILVKLISKKLNKMAG